MDKVRQIEKDRLIWGGRDHQGRDRNSQTEIMGRERGVDLLID